MTGAAPRYRRILLTGGGGFVGGHLCPRLVGAFPDAARVLVSRPGEPAGRAGFETRTLDLLDREAVQTLVSREKPDLVMHLAAQASVGAAAKAATSTWRVNVEGSVNLADAVARHAPGATLFFVSTGEVYGSSFNEGPAAEDATPRPANVYARTKLAAEQALADIHKGALVVARAFNHTGAGQNEQFVLPAFAAQIAAIEAGGPPRLTVGNLDAERDFLDVADVCDAYLALLTRLPGDARETVNVASGRPRRIGDLLAGLRALARRPFEVVVDPARLRPSEVPRAVGLARRLRDLTGWAPRVPIEDTLRAVLDDQRARVATPAASAAR